MRFDLARVAGVELVVEQRVKQDLCFVAGHFACSSSASPGRAQHGAGACEAGHHGADGGADGLGDFAIGQIVDLPQHEGFLERFGERIDQLADGAGVAAAQHLGFRARLGLLPDRRLLGGAGHILDRGGRMRAPCIFGVADVAQDREQPGLHRGPAIAVEMLAARADSIPAPHPRRRRHRAADSARACRRRRDKAARLRGSAAPSADRRWRGIASRFASCSARCFVASRCVTAGAEPAGVGPPAGQDVDALV